MKIILLIVLTSCVFDSDQYKEQEQDKENLYLNNPDIERAVMFEKDLQ
jgi:hypothetical protein